MTVDISIAGLDDALGRSVIYDEYKGDLAQARELADQQLAHARQQPDVALLADALLARAVVDLLQGESPAALACCDEIAQLTDAAPLHQFRAAVYATLAAYQHLNAFPSGLAADGTEFELRSPQFLSLLATYSQRRNQSQPQIDAPAALLEQSLVADCLPSLLLARSFIIGASFSSAEFGAKLLDMALQTPPRFREQVADLALSPSLRAYIDLAAADLHQRAGQPQVAEQLLEVAIAGYTSANDPAGLAACYMRRGDWLAAPFSTPLALNLALRSSTVDGSQLTSSMEALEFSSVGQDAAAALAAYAEAEHLFQQAHAPRGLAAIRLRRGYLAFLADDAQAALAAAQEAETQFAASGDRLGYWLARIHVALMRIAAGQLPEDQITAQEVGSWGAGAGSFSYALGLGILCSRMGRHWLLRRGDYERALACFRLARALNTALGATIHQAQNVVDQAATLQSIGERAGALTLYEQAIELYLHEMQRYPQIVETLRQRTILLGTYLYHLYDQHMNADGMERTATRLSQQIGEVGGLVGGFFDVAAGVLKGSGQDRALDQSLTLMAAHYAREVIGTANVLVPSYRARAARDRGDTREMQRQFELAEAAVQQIDGDSRDFLHGVVLVHQRRYTEAAALFRRHFASGSGNILSQALAAFGAQGSAEAQLHARRNHEQAASAFVRLRAYDEAKRHFDLLEQQAGAAWWSDQERPWETLSDYGEMYEGLGRLPDALAAYDRAIGLLEERREQLSRDELKTALAAGRGPQYLYFYAARAAQKWQAQLYRSGDRTQARTIVARAFAYAERAKARALLDLIAGSAALSGAARIESVPLRSWRELTARLTLWRGLLARERGQQSPDAERITTLSRQIAEGEGELHQVERELAHNDPNFYRLIDPGVQLLSVDAVSAALPPQTALLSYLFLGEELLLWAITGEGVALAYLASLDVKALERDIRAFHRACEQRQPLDRLGAALSAALLGPLADVLRANTRLLIVPHGVAHTLPFQALPWQGQPLAATHTISYLPSASALQFLRPGQSTSASRILAVGDPARMSFQPPSTDARIDAAALPAAAAEAAYVAALFPERRVLIGEQATEAAVRAEIDQYALLHFATHGYLSEDAPLLSAILLANGDALNVYEIMSLQLRADLVVLSACRTALGETTGGDDVLGLTRGLLGAGARAAVVSLWPVSDVSTSLLMGAFYRHLRAGQSPARALQAAQHDLRSLSAADMQRELARLRQSLDAAGTADLQTSTRDLVLPDGAPLDLASDYSHPFYWAPFIVVG